MSINTKDLKKYAKAGLNVILSGPHGVGKTAVIKEVFNETFGEHYTNWRYFSASTLDPWVDFIGIPKNYTRPDGKEVFGIIPPDHFTGEENIQAIFFDEINRAEEKTLNALMELIQFRSINGRKFPNLKCIWAAENPSDDDENEYMVKKLDPAQRDRFQIQMYLKNELAIPYMKAKFGEDVTKVSAKWWNSVKKDISPRKLDDMLSGFIQGFNLSHYVPQNVDARSLQKSLEAINEIETIKSIVASGEDAVKAYFTLEKINQISPVFEIHPNIAIDISGSIDKEIVSKLKDLVDPNTKDKINEKLSRKKAVGFGNPNFKAYKKLTGEDEDIADQVVANIDLKELNFSAFNNRTNFQDEFYTKISNFNSKVNRELCKDRKMKGWNIQLPSYVNTYYFQKFIDFANSKNHENTFNEFMKNLATVVVYTKNKKAEEVFRKIQGCAVMKQKFKINDLVAKKILAYANGKDSRIPHINDLMG